MRISDWSSDVCSSDLELNVALGGSLHVRVHEVPGRLDHRRPQHPELDVQYGPHHPVTLRPGGPLAALAKAAGVTGSLMVNSLHWSSAERRVGKECVRTWSSRGAPDT